MISILKGFLIAVIVIFASQCSDGGKSYTEMSEEIDREMSRCRAIADNVDPLIGDRYVSTFDSCMNEKYDWSN